MTTTKIGSGLAFTPEKDLAMFAEMAANGKRLSGIGALGHGWTFVDAPPEHAVFDMTYEANPDPGYFDTFEAVGWSLVLSAGDTHIFKAVPGTPPVHSNNESRREELLRQRNMFAIYGTIALAFFTLVGFLLRHVSWGVWEVPILLVAITPVVYTIAPLVGYMHRISNKLR